MGSTVKKGGWRTNKWIRAAIPALLLHCSIGTVYCWSTFSEQIGDHIGFDKSAVEWAFSFAIFFLGMSAAFLGNVVEKDIHKSSLIATICFSVGMAGSGFFIWYGGTHQGSLLSLIGIYVCYGLIMGVGLGMGYLSPVKTLMLWFKDNKGLATGLAVAGFGAAKAIATPIMEWLMNSVFGKEHFYWMFVVLAGVYFVMMFVGHLLLKKPDDWHEPQSASEKKSMMSVIKSRPIVNYIGIWLMFYLNITCGLMLISQEKYILKCLGLSVVVFPIISAVFNAGGRLGFSSLGDKCKDRNTIYKVIFALSILCTAVVVATQGIVNGNVDGKQNLLLVSVVVVLIMMVNAGYGGGFSNLPTLLSDHYGMSNISAIHGITLSAWGFAGLTGNNLASLIVNKFGEEVTVNGNTVNPSGYQAVLYATLALYIVSLILSFVFVRPMKNKEK